MRIIFRSGLYGRQLSEIYLADRTTLAVRAGNVDARLEWNLPDDMHLTRRIWAHVADRTRLTPTTLRALSYDDCVLLVAHGYREATAVLYERGARQYGSRTSLSDQGDLGVAGEPGAFVEPS